MYSLLAIATNAKLTSSFIVTALPIKRYLYFFTGLCSLSECSYFGKLFYFVDFLNTVSGWFVTFLFNTWKIGIV